MTITSNYTTLPWNIQSWQRTTLHLDLMLSFEVFVNLPPHHPALYWQDRDGQVQAYIKLGLKQIFSALLRAYR